MAGLLAGLLGSLLFAVVSVDPAVSAAIDHARCVVAAAVRVAEYPGDPVLPCPEWPLKPR